MVSPYILYPVPTSFHLVPNISDHLDPINGILVHFDPFWTQKWVLGVQMKSENGHIWNVRVLTWIDASQVCIQSTYKVKRKQLEYYPSFKSVHHPSVSKYLKKMSMVFLKVDGVLKIRVTHKYWSKNMSSPSEFDWKPTLSMCATGIRYYTNIEKVFFQNPLKVPSSCAFEMIHFANKCNINLK